CLCPGLPPMETDTRIVLLMHPMEWRREKCTTGRLACLNLANSEIIQGIDFDEHPRLRELVDDPGNRPMLLYPGIGSHNLSEGPFPGEAFPGGPAASGGPAAGPGGDPVTFAGRRRLVVFLIDATWTCAKVIARHNPGLLALPRLMFTPSELSRWTIKRQPADWCLSTIEAIHELLLSLEAAGLDSYPDKDRLLSAFAAMQDYQILRRDRDGHRRFLARNNLA
ncbi:MAG: tRNA-uridine aminocarboxypropyltransferase, partial [Rectinemataceae bacterium]